jgi:uncharacterized membrane protein YgdD (TMEM256/DUF423 family)
MHRLWIGLGGLLGCIAVGMAAVAAHALSNLSPAMVRVVGDGVQMQGWHALALVATGVWAHREGGLAHWAGAGFVLGTVLFCGSTYSLALAGVSWGFLAPAGGIVLMLSWLLLSASALRAR